MTSPRFAFILLLSLALTGLRAQAVPSTINYQGRLTDNSPQQNPLTATVNFQFALYDAASAGTQLWQEPAGAAVLPVSVTGGIFTVLLGGNGVPLPTAVFTGGATRYLQITANGEVLAPRQVIGATGYADQAQNAAQAVNATTAANSAQLGGVAAAGYQLATTQSCASGSFLQSINAAGTAACASANGALTPPVSLSASLAAPVFSATNTGAGNAGVFTVNNTGNSQAALTATSNGTSNAIYAYTSGSGPFNRAAYFQSGGSTSETMISETFSTTGSAAWIRAQNTSGTGSALEATTEGLGKAGEFVIDNGTSGAAAISATTAGTGPGLLINLGNTAARGIQINGLTGQAGNLTEWQKNGSPLSWVDGSGIFHGNGSSLTGVTAAALTLPYAGSNGGGSDVFAVTASGSSGRAGAFTASGGTNAAAALLAQSAGTGSALQVNQTGASPANPALDVSAASGAAARLANANTAATLYVYNTGSGWAGNFNSAGNAPTILALNSGSGASGSFGNTGTGSGLVASSTAAGTYAVSAQAGGAGVLPLAVFGASGQTANLQAWVSNTGTPLAWVDNAGAFHGNGSGLTGVSASGLALPYAGSQAVAGGTDFSITNSATAASNDFAIKGISTNPESSGSYEHAGVYGLAASGTTGGVGVEGQGSQSGVHGVSLSASTAYTSYGVRGEATSSPLGIGVRGDGNSVGVWGIGPVALYSQPTTPYGTALDIVWGSIRSEGAGVGTNTPVFIQRATAANSVGDYTIITHPMTDGDPNAILIVTPNYNPGGTGGVYNIHATGVFYLGGSTNKWAIFNQDGSAIPLNAAFNVLVIKP